MNEGNKMRMKRLDWIWVNFECVGLHLTADKGWVTGGQNCRASIAAFFSELRAFEASLGAGHPPGSSSGQSWLHARCFWYFCCSLSRSCFSSVAAAAGQDGWYGIGS